VIENGSTLIKRSEEVKEGGTKRKENECMPCPLGLRAGMERETERRSRRKSEKSRIQGRRTRESSNQVLQPLSLLVLPSWR